MSEQVRVTFERVVDGFVLHSTGLEVQVGKGKDGEFLAMQLKTFVSQRLDTVGYARCCLCDKWFRMEEMHEDTDGKDVSFVCKSCQVEDDKRDAQLLNARQQFDQLLGLVGCNFNPLK